MKQQISTFAEIAKSRAVVEAVIDKEYANSAKKPTYNELVKAIDAQQVKNTEMLKISVQSGSPQEAQQVASALAAALNERMTEIVRFENKQARVFLGESLAEARRNLDKAEKAFVEYKKTKGAVTPTSQTNLFLEKQSILTRQLADNQLALAASQARTSNLSRQLARQNPESIADSPLIQQYKSRLAEQETEFAGLSKNLTTAHPRMIALQATIASTRASLQAEIAKVINQEAGSSSPVYQVLMQSRIQAEADLAAAQVQRGALEHEIANQKKGVNPTAG